MATALGQMFYMHVSVALASLAAGPEHTSVQQHSCHIFAAFLAASFLPPAITSPDAASEAPRSKCPMTREKGADSNGTCERPTLLS